MPALFTAIFLSFVQLCSSCAREDAAITDEIERINSIADIKPDTAFIAIRSIEKSALKSTEAFARYCLVYSKVLDKNYIDVTSDTLIAPALHYYSRQRSGKEKAETYYYAGRIQENAGNYSKSMEYLHNAEKSLPDEISELNSLIYSTKARIYHNSIEYNSAAINYSKAADIYMTLDNKNRYCLNKLREADCLLKCGLVEETHSIIESLEHLLIDLPESTVNKYYQIKITHLEMIGSEETARLAEIYESTIQNKKIIDWIMLARIALSYREANSALEALQMHRLYNSESGVYYYYLAKAYEALGDWPEAAKAFKEYISIHSGIGAEILSQDTRFVEERQIHQDAIEKEKSRRMILSLTATVSLMALVLASLIIANIRKQLKIEHLKKENLQNQLDELMLEREELAALEDRNQEGRKIISERLRIIDQFVMSDAFHDSIFEAKASQKLKAIIGDRAEFVRQNRLIFNQSSPAFIAHLSEKGLTDIEIDHCCLYAIGMNGKMVTTFTNAKRHYHIGSDVRKKLGLSTHDTNISIYIRNLYQQLQG
jgi:tetratricopeptide (TPR) repeat protein